MDPWTRTVVVLLVGLGVGCARRIETQTKVAFERAQTGSSTDSGDNDAVVRPADRRAPEMANARGPRGVDTALVEAVASLKSGDPESLARLATKWCSQEPEPQTTEFGVVWVCFPEPPVQTGGQGLTLELGGTGMVGLVSSSLSGAESQRVLASALQAVGRLCTESWQIVSNRENGEEVHTCPLAEGPVLAVGRLPRDIDADLWQVSVTLLAAT